MLLVWSPTGEIVDGVGVYRGSGRYSRSSRGGGGVGVVGCGMHNQPLVRALAQLARDVRRENPRMAPIVLRDYLRFGPMNALQLFGELVRGRTTWLVVIG